MHTYATRDMTMAGLRLLPPIRPSERRKSRRKHREAAPGPASGLVNYLHLARAVVYVSVQITARRTEIRLITALDANHCLKLSLGNVCLAVRNFISPPCDHSRRIR